MTQNMFSLLTQCLTCMLISAARQLVLILLPVRGKLFHYFLNKKNSAIWRKKISLSTFDFWVNIRVKKALCYIFQLKPCTVQKKRVSNPLICEQFTCLYETNIKNIFCYFCANLYREVRPPTFSKKKKYSSHFGQNSEIFRYLSSQCKKKKLWRETGQERISVSPMFWFRRSVNTYDIACSWDMNAKVCTILVRTRLWKRIQSAVRHFEMKDLFC